MREIPRKIAGPACTPITPLGVWPRVLGKLDAEDPVAAIVVSVDDDLPTWFSNWEQKTRLDVRYCS